MIKNFILIAIRHLTKNRSFTLINLIGLSTGLAGCFLILLFIQSERSVDQHHHSLSRLYRMNTLFHNIDEGELESATSGPPIGFTLKNEIPEIEEVTRIFQPLSAEEYLISFQDKKFYEKDAGIADSTFFAIFTYPFLEGNPKTALNEPNKVVISATLAKKLFNNQNALSKTISITDDFGKQDYQVTGVIDSKSFRSHFDVNYITSMYTAGWGKMVNEFESWASQNFIYTYFKLYPQSNPSVVENKIKKVVNQRAQDDFAKAGYTKDHHLEPLADIYLQSSARNDWSSRGSATLNRILGAIALLILTLACVNYINLTTAKSTQRSREIGIRKTLGAYRSQIIRQFLTESMILSLAAVTVGLLISSLLLPYFNDFFELSLSIDFVNNPQQLLLLLGITLLAGLVSGTYPAFILSGVIPIKALKMSEQLSGGGGGLRRGLVVTQYLIAITLLICVAVIYQQLRYSMSLNDELAAESKLVMPLRTNLAAETFQDISNKLTQHTDILKISAADYVPGKNVLSDFKLYPSGSNMEQGSIVNFNRVDPRYTDIFNLKIIAGRDFKETQEVENNLIINQKAIEIFNWTPEQAIGQQLFTHWDDSVYQFNVVGVMDNYAHTSTHEELIPIALEVRDSRIYNNGIVEFNTSSTKEVLSFIENTWSETEADTPFDFFFLEDTLAQQYENEERSMGIISAFAILAILISSLGLYGLSTYTVQKRNKEISIRKIMGASSANLTLLLTKQYFQLLVVAFLLSIPLAYFLMQKWLQNFAYKIEIDSLVFIFIGSVVALFTLFIIGFHTYQATLQNPVNTLRND